MEEATPVDKKPVVAGTVLKGRWKLVQKIGQGAFGEIFSGNDQTTLDPVAVKLERWDSKKAVLKMEVAVLKKLQRCQFACRYVHCGHFEDYNYLVMELLGENLSELRRRRPGRFEDYTYLGMEILGENHSELRGRFSLWTTVRIGTQMLRAVEVRPPDLSQPDLFQPT
ncbi:kinase-like domain-containing protein [Baffinella frigidus]|nr:kinase-like domain-containing protein [Cryptophyta sp. CCMP2293]